MQTQNHLTHEQIEQLPNPHLRHYVDSSIFSLDEADYKDAVRLAYLRAAGLPDTYDQMTAEQQKAARWSVLTSWYDPGKPNELVADIDKYIKAHFLWVEFFLKPDEQTGGTYFFKDSRVKYDLLRSAFGPPVNVDEPSKCVMHCPRGTTKTRTVIHEACSLMAACRPNTEILVSEINKDRTVEEMGRIRDIYERNALIRYDLGGQGSLYQKQSKSGSKWNDHQLDVLRFPGCTIKGYSFKSRQRGRHPILGIIDDPEDEDTVADQSFRQKFFHNLFRRYMGMFYRGGKIVWIGTVIRNSCLQIALKSITQDAVDAQDLEENFDERFESWNKIHIGMIQTDQKTGERFSIMSDHTSVESYDQKNRSYGAATVAAEYDGKPIAEGQTALVRDEYRHGFMYCQRKQGQSNVPDEYMLDLNTGRVIEWRLWLASLHTATGCDIADSVQKDADRGSVIAIGIDPSADVYVLDAIVKRQISDDWPETAFNMAVEWEASRAGFEVAAMQRVYYRMAQRLRDDFEDKGLIPPTPVPVVTSGQKKHMRVLGTLRPLYRKRKIRFRYFMPVTTPDGITHYPAPYENRRYYIELLRELDSYTDSGPSGHDDAADGLQIAIVAAGRLKGIEAEPQDESKLQLERWKQAGIEWHPGLLPENLRPAEPPPEIVETHDRRISISRPDPYAFL